MDRRDLLKAAAVAPISMATAGAILATEPDRLRTHGDYDETPELVAAMDEVAKGAGDSIEEAMNGRFNVVGRCIAAYGYNDVDPRKTMVNLGLTKTVVEFGMRFSVVGARELPIVRPELWQENRLRSMLSDEQEARIDHVLLDAVIRVPDTKKRWPIQIALNMELDD